MTNYYVLTTAAARALGIHAEGNDLEPTVSPQKVAAMRLASESSHSSYEQAVEAAQATGYERWIMDESGESSWVPAEGSITLELE